MQVRNVFALIVGALVVAGVGTPLMLLISSVFIHEGIAWWVFFGAAALCTLCLGYFVGNLLAKPETKLLRAICPECGGQAISKAALQPEGFSLRAARKCQSCGARWIPSAGRWFGLLPVLMGGGGLVLACWVMSAMASSVPHVRWGMIWVLAGVLGLFGVIALTYGFAIAVGAAGKLRVLHEGKKGGGPMTRDNQ
ncbi:MAG TPA: hypothetical protein VNA25_27060 [Phycisphaerae bacterium]|nr:hypothetical protein [Phycisphaerae bacterium]